jgi:hypothetical protein
MPRWSETFRMPGGGSAIVCFSGRRPPTLTPCRCGARSTIQCDFPIADGRTCDAYLCRRCAIHQGPDRDYCPDHQPALPERF